MRRISLPFVLILLACAPRVARAQAVRLELEEVSTDVKGIMFPEKWVHDADRGTASWSSPWGQASYRVELPKVIDAATSASFNIRVSAAERSRFAPGMGLKGEVDVNPSAELGVLAEPDETKEESKSFKITPRSYSSDAKSILLIVGIQDGPAFHYRYRIVRGGEPPRPEPYGGPPARGGLYLELEQVTAEGTGIMYSDRWTYDPKQGTAEWSPPWGHASYRADLPRVIDAGSSASLSIRVAAAERSRFAPGMWLKGEVDVSPSAELGVLAEPGETKEDTKSFKIKPARYSADVRSIVLILGIQDGPTFHYRYQIVRN